MNKAVVCNLPPRIAEPGKGSISRSVPQASLTSLRYVILSY